MTANLDLTTARPAPDVLAWGRELVEPALREAVQTLPPTMRRIVGYHFGWWEADESPRPGPANVGKAIRPALALLSAEAVGAAPHTALPAAVAVELVHNFSLIQDDVIDGDLTRRHRPTAWSVFGSGQAIVAGDALLALAYDALATGPSADWQAGQGLLRSTVLDLMEGQLADLSFEQRTDVAVGECLTMAEQKSGALLGGACALGAWLGNAAPRQVTGLREFGIQVGAAFQLADDLLGIWGDPTATGKPVHSDLHRRKKSLPLVAALNAGGPAAALLASLYYRTDAAREAQSGQPTLSEAEVRRTAELIEQAGGRSWCQRQAADLLAGALDRLREAVGDSRPAAELAGLARLATYRDR